MMLACSVLPMATFMRLFSCFHNKNHRFLSKIALPSYVYSYDSPLRDSTVVTRNKLSLYDFFLPPQTNIYVLSDFLLILVIA